MFPTNEEIILPISLENCSESKRDGKIVLRGDTKSISWAEKYILRDWSIKVGVKNHIDTTIRAIKTHEIKSPESVLLFIFLLSLS